MIDDGEIAPGDVVAWHDYYNDHVTNTGLVLALAPEQALILWSDGHVDSYDCGKESSLVFLFGSTIKSRLMWKQPGT